MGCWFCAKVGEVDKVFCLIDCFHNPAREKPYFQFLKLNRIDKPRDPKTLLTLCLKGVRIDEMKLVSTKRSNFAWIDFGEKKGSGLINIIRQFYTQHISIGVQWTKYYLTEFMKSKYFINFSSGFKTV